MNLSVSKGLREVGALSSEKITCEECNTFPHPLTASGSRYYRQYVRVASTYFLSPMVYLLQGKSFIEIVRDFKS